MGVHATLIFASAVLLLAAASLLYLHQHGGRVVSVQSGSMEPTFRRGDALIIEPAATHDLRAGEIVSYVSPRDPSITITHRLVSVDRRGGTLITAGDKLRTTDPPFDTQRVVGRAVAVAPYLGFAIDALRHPLGLVLAVYLPACLVIFGEIRRLATAESSPKYRLRAHRPNL